jgi:hypothetical protein
MGLSERFLALGICPWRVVHAGIRSYDPRGPDKAHATLSPHGLNRSRESSGVEIAPRSPTPRDARRGWVVRGLLCAQWRHRPCPISTEGIARVGFLKLFKCSRQTLMLKCAPVRPVGVLARSGPHHLVRLARATGTPSCRSSLGFALPLGSTLVPASQNDARNADGRGAPRGPHTEALSHSKAANLGSPGGARRIAGRARHSRAVHIVVTSWRGGSSTVLAGRGKPRRSLRPRRALHQARPGSTKGGGRTLRVWARQIRISPRRNLRPCARRGSPHYHRCLRVWRDCAQAWAGGRGDPKASASARGLPRLWGRLR